VINQAMPQALISAAKAAKPGKGASQAKISGSMCVKPMIELFHDEQEIMRLITATWHRHHAIDASLKPWGPYQKISDVNPQVLHPDHLQKSCMSGFWARGFESEPASGVRMKSCVEAYCRDHECIEVARDLCPQLMMQLARGFFTYDDWDYVCSRTEDTIKGAIGKRLGLYTFQGKQYHLKTSMAGHH
jgi:hypothetical protein